MVNWPQVSVSIDKELDMCFGCGPKNPIGLKLKFAWDGKVARAEFIPSKLHQGWSMVVHGGIIGCLLDEAMSYAAWFSGLSTVTARMETRFKRPVPIDEFLVITASLTRKTRKLVAAKAEVTLRDGAVVADSTTTMFVLGQRKETK